MLIETQETPDRNVLNFFPPVRILKSGTAEFVDAKSLRKSPLAWLREIPESPEPEFPTKVEKLTISGYFKSLSSTC